MPTIIKEFKRPSKELIESYAGLATPDICYAMDNTRAMDHRIRPVFKGARAYGPAITVRLGPGDNLFCHKVIEYIQEGDMVVVSTLVEDTAGWGEFTSLSAKMKGAQGAVIDGAVTDVREIEEMKFPIFAKAITPRTTFREGYGDINIRVVCGGVAIDPGDLVVADENGVVVVPLLELEEVLEKAKKKVALEDEARKEILKGKTLPQLSRVDDTLREKGIL